MKSVPLNVAKERVGFDVFCIIRVDNLAREVYVPHLSCAQRPMADNHIVVLVASS